VLLTWGELPLSAIRKNNIIIDESDSRPLITVRITDFCSREYYSYVKHDLSLAVCSNALDSYLQITDAALF
jgi:hypothetical protein